LLRQRVKPLDCRAHGGAAGDAVAVGAERRIERDADRIERASDQPGDPVADRSREAIHSVSLRPPSIGPDGRVPVARSTVSRTASVSGIVRSPW